ncbi:MAG: tetratricopeptide repeat protein [Betaproteobacteria bacterium]|nr:tetratricopeptide repeat protein [Betaproteobacteria bacterium]
MISEADRTMPVAVDRENRWEMRWRVALAGAVIAIVAAVGMFVPVPAGMQAKRAQTPEVHAIQMRREEVARRFEQGVVMLHAKDYEHALTAFHRVLQLEPDMPEAYVNSGFALLGLGEAKAAADYFESATQIRPDQMNAYYGLGEALMALGNRLGALQAMETYLHRAPAADPFRVKAEAAVWELRSAMAGERPTPAATGLSPHRPTEGKP